MPRFEDVIGLEKQKRHLRDIVLRLLEHPKLDAELGSALIRRALLMGNHGTGKTYIAEALVEEAGIAVFRMDLRELANKRPADVGDALGSLFDEAVAAEPSLVLVDGCDSLLGRRRSETETQRVSKCLFREALDRLEEMNARRVYVIAICNRDLDEGIVNRMRYAIRFPAPDGPERREALQRFLHQRLGQESLERSAVDGLIQDYRWNQLVDETYGWSYRLIRMYCDDVAERAVEPSGASIFPTTQKMLYDADDYDDDDDTDSSDSESPQSPLPRWEHFEAAFRHRVDPSAEARQRESESIERKREENEEGEEDDGADKKKEPSEDDRSLLNRINKNFGTAFRSTAECVQRESEKIKRKREEKGNDNGDNNDNGASKKKKKPTEVEEEIEQRESTPPIQPAPLPFPQIDMNEADEEIERREPASLSSALSDNTLFGGSNEFHATARPVIPRGDDSKEAPNEVKGSAERREPTSPIQPVPLPSTLSDETLILEILDAHPKSARLAILREDDNKKETNEVEEDTERREPTPPIRPAPPSSTLFDKMLSAGLDESSATAYLPILEENDVDEKMLPKVTASQYKKMGIVKVGHQIKLSRISKLPDPRPATESPQPPLHEARTASPASASTPRKNCSECGVEKPATRKFFFFMERRRDLNSLCKICETKLAPGMHACSVCREKRPSTAEHFYLKDSSKGSLQSDCISCSKDAYKKRKQ